MTPEINQTEHKKTKSKLKSNFFGLFLIFSLFLIGTLSFFAADTATAAVKVIHGPTPIPNGDALSKGDLTVVTDTFAVAFSVETLPPWGVAIGSILDVAAVRDGKIGKDHASLVDFLPNSWTSWPTTYQKVTVEKETSKEVVIRTLRDWGIAQSTKVELDTTWTIKDGEDTIHMVTVMINKGDSTKKDILSGYVAWNTGGHIFNTPGMGKTKKGDVAGHAFADWAATYDRDWFIGLHGPYLNHSAYYGRDLYLRHTLKPGESRTLEGWLQLGSSGDLMPIVHNEIKRLNKKSGTLTGIIRDLNGETVSGAAIFVRKGGEEYFFTLGNKDGSYTATLPVGKYSVQAMGPGYSSSKMMDITMVADAKLTQDFAGLEPPGKLTLNVRDADSKKPLNARILIEEGAKPIIGFFGRYSFFTDFNKVGQATLTLAPGLYKLNVSHASGFKANSVIFESDVQSGNNPPKNINIALLAHPEDKKWFSMDTHHHSNVLDGFSKPVDVVRAQLAAGLDISLISDHGSTEGIPAGRKAAEKRNQLFVASIEISPSWAHFNAIGFEDDAVMPFDANNDDVHTIFEGLREIGVKCIIANHPYIPYGYFSSRDKGLLPGLIYDPKFDLVAITAKNQPKLLTNMWSMWNLEQHYYLAAGSDNHNVWKGKTTSGSGRSYVYLKDGLSEDAFIDNLINGHSFATFGPLVYPDAGNMYGNTIEVKADTAVTLKYQVQAVSGIKHIQLVERGQIVKTMDLEKDNVNTIILISFNHMPTNKKSWYSVMVEDMKGNVAVTNPVWVNVK